jgi:hypothetical protein
LIRMHLLQPEHRLVAVLVRGRRRRVHLSSKSYF